MVAPQSVLHLSCIYTGLPHSFQVKRSTPVKHLEKSSSKDGKVTKVLQDCLGTINQHMAQLLISARDSLFAQNFVEYDHTKNLAPASSTVYVFGMMTHGTKVSIQYTISKRVLNKCVTRRFLQY